MVKVAIYKLERPKAWSSVFAARGRDERHASARPRGGAPPGPERPRHPLLSEKLWLCVATTAWKFFHLSTREPPCTPPGSP